MTAPPRFIGAAGWSIPRAVASEFPTEGTGLERYAARFGAAEINTSFYRPHRPATYARWAASVPDGFKFAVKLPRAATHEAKLVDCAPVLERFSGEIAGLGDKCGPVLVQLPPKLSFDTDVARDFFKLASRILGGPIVCEPRHASWFEPEAEILLAEHHIARVAADPARVPGGDKPGGWTGLTYIRLHGSPRIYCSGYDEAALAEWAEAVATTSAETWVIFDNTASGRAAQDALAFSALAPCASPGATRPARTGRAPETRHRARR